MTDQTIPDVTDDERSLARKWAEDIESDMDTWGDGIRAAARVILDAVPAPSPPTLADMTEEERAACQWMQADTKLWGRVVIIVPDLSDGRAALLERCGDVIYGRYVNVTPRPDLPRLEWPGTEKPAPAPALPDGWRLADHQKRGRVIVTTTTPDDDGDFYFMFPADDLVGYDWDACRPAELTYLDGPTTKGGDTTTGPDHLAVGTVIESAADPRLAALPDGSILLDRDDDSVTKRDGAWSGNGYVPNKGEGDKFGPWTVLHTQKEEA